MLKASENECVSMKGLVGYVCSPTSVRTGKVKSALSQVGLYGMCYSV